MPFTDILAQEHIIEHFKRVIESDHLSHAYIFSGEGGVGKTLFAKEFIKALFCRNAVNDSCNSCLNCIRIEKNNHPDISWIDVEEKAKFIKIENIRALQNSVRLSPLESDYKIFIIKNADRMNEESSNCLLKTLEEPSPNTIFVLITNSIHNINDTVRSRCQIIRFQPIPTRIIENQLTGKSETDEHKIRWIARSCNGSLGNALDMVDNNHYEINNSLITRMTEQDTDILVFAEEVIDSYLKSSEDFLEGRRQALKIILNCILRFYRDLLFVKAISGKDVQRDKALLFNEGREDTLQRYASYITQEQIINVIDELLLLTTYIDYNLNINLLVENVINRVTIMKSEKT